MEQPQGVASPAAPALVVAVDTLASSLAFPHPDQAENNGVSADARLDLMAFEDPFTPSLQSFAATQLLDPSSEYSACTDDMVWLASLDGDGSSLESYVRAVIQRARREAEREALEKRGGASTSQSDEKEKRSSQPPPARGRFGKLLNRVSSRVFSTASVDALEAPAAPVPPPSLAVEVVRRSKDWARPARAMQFAVVSHEDTVRRAPGDATSTTDAIAQEGLLSPARSEVSCRSTSRVIRSPVPMGSDLRVPSPAPKAADAAGAGDDQVANAPTAPEATVTAFDPEFEQHSSDMVEAVGGAVSSTVAALLRTPSIDWRLTLAMNAATQWEYTVTVAVCRLLPAPWLDAPPAQQPHMGDAAASPPPVPSTLISPVSDHPIPSPAEQSDTDDGADGSAGAGGDDARKQSNDADDVRSKSSSVSSSSVVKRLVAVRHVQRRVYATPYRAALRDGDKTSGSISIASPVSNGPASANGPSDFQRRCDEFKVGDDVGALANAAFAALCQSQRMYFNIDDYDGDGEDFRDIKLCEGYTLAVMLHAAPAAAPGSPRSSQSPTHTKDVAPKPSTQPAEGDDPDERASATSPTAASVRSQCPTQNDLGVTAATSALDRNALLAASTLPGSSVFRGIVTFKDVSRLLVKKFGPGGPYAGVPVPPRVYVPLRASTGRSEIAVSVDDADRMGTVSQKPQESPQDEEVSTSSFASKFGSTLRTLGGFDRPDQQPSSKSAAAKQATGKSSKQSSTAFGSSFALSGDEALRCAVTHVSVDLSVLTSRLIDDIVAARMTTATGPDDEDDKAVPAPWCVVPPTRALLDQCLEAAQRK